jgi:GxxExxY protein
VACIKPCRIAEKKLWISGICGAKGSAGKLILFHAKAQRKRKGGEVIMSENELANIAVNICFSIHTQYGPGLFEKVYEEIFVYEWNKTGIDIVRQKGIKVIHEGVDLGVGFVPDLIVGNKLILELKSVEQLGEIHHKQLLTYLRLTGIRLGLLINFNVPLIKNGMKRIVNNL